MLTWQNYIRCNGENALLSVNYCNGISFYLLKMKERKIQSQSTTLIYGYPDNSVAREIFWKSRERCLGQEGTTDLPLPGRTLLSAFESCPDTHNAHLQFWEQISECWSEFLMKIIALKGKCGISCFLANGVSSPPTLSPLSSHNPLDHIFLFPHVLHWNWWHHSWFTAMET